MTDPLGQSQVIPYLQKLSTKGYNITILSTEKRENFDLNHLYISELLKKTNIQWEYIWYTKKPPIISTIKDIQKLKAKAKTLNAINNYKLTHCRSYISAFVGLYLKKKDSVKFLFDMRGFYADERVDGGIWNLKNPAFYLVYKFFKKKELDFLSESSAVVSLTATGKTEIKQWEKLKNNKQNISVIPCCADFNHFSKTNINISLKNKYIEDLNIQKDDFIISYLGSIGTWYLLDEMLDFFKELLLKKPKAKFLFITKDDKDFIENKALAKNIELNKIIIQPANRNEVPTLLSLSNISLFFIKPVFSKKASSPTKLAEILGMGIPIIANNNVGDLNLIFSQNNVGELVTAFNTKEYNKVINNIDDILKLNPDDLANISSNLFSLEMGAESYHSIYKRLTTT